MSASICRIILTGNPIGMPSILLLSISIIFNHPKAISDEFLWQLELRSGYQTMGDKNQDIKNRNLATVSLSTQIGWRWNKYFQSYLGIHTQIHNQITPANSVDGTNTGGQSHLTSIGFPLLWRNFVFDPSLVIYGQYFLNKSGINDGPVIYERPFGYNAKIGWQMKSWIWSLGYQMISFNSVREGNLTFSRTSNPILSETFSLGLSYEFF
jgi:hypothetical protein